jgi:EmrB/QacA subfamily drug resistance transporter
MRRQQATAQPSRPSPARPHDRRWWVLAVIATAQLMLVLDSTIVNIALPSAQRDLGFADSNRQWIVTAYALAFGSLLLLSGRIGDIFGRKKTFIVGLIGFAIVSAIGGAAQNFATLVAARAVQGVFGALIAPSALSLLATTFSDPKERGKAFGVFGAVAGGGGALGLLLSGVLTSYASWRWCLYINLVFAVVAVIGGLWVLVDPPRGKRRTLDVPGTMLAAGGVFGIVFGFARAQTNTWTSPATVISLGLGVVLLAAFVQVQRIVAHPLLPMRIVLDRNRAGAYLAVGLTFTAGFALFLFLAYYLQQVRNFSPVQTGAAFLPMPAGIVVMSTLANTKLMPRFGPRRLIVFGLLLGFIGMALLTRLNANSSYALAVLPSLILIGVGIGSIIPPALNSATSGVDPHDAGVASAMVNTAQQLGGSIGTALLSTFAAQATARYLRDHAGSPVRAQIAKQAATSGYTTAFTIAAGIFLGAAILCGAMLRTQNPTVTTT